VGKTVTTNGGYIRIDRDEGFWADGLRAYGLVVDGEVVARIREGETQTVAVPAGERDVHLTIDYCRSRRVTIDVEPGRTLNIKCWPNSSAWSFLFFLTIGCTHYIGVSV
jgi:hypothetical protein